MNHTPGPWKGQRGHKTPLVKGVYADNGKCVVRFNGIASPDSDEGQANVSLIIAAPYLLEAAERALALIEKGAPGWGVAKDLLRAAIHEARPELRQSAAGGLEKESK